MSSFQEKTPQEQKTPQKRFSLEFVFKTCSSLSKNIYLFLKVTHTASVRPEQEPPRSFFFCYTWLKLCVLLEVMSTRALGWEDQPWRRSFLTPASAARRTGLRPIHLQRRGEPH